MNLKMKVNSEESLSSWLVALVLFMSSVSVWAADPTNLVPNPGFLPGGGFVETGGGGGTVVGDVPVSWRGFAVGGGGITINTIPLAPDELFPGSPATNALELTIDAFGGDQGFDHEITLFSMSDDRQYQLSVYLRSNNADLSSQITGVSFNQFGMTNQGLGSITPTVPTTWTRYEGPLFVGIDGTKGDLAFRLGDDGGDDSILIALPEVIGAAQANQVPNPGFEGMAGTIQGVVSGDIPDQWRGFAVGGGDITIARQAIAAGEMYPGSPATLAVRMTTNTFGQDQGFDSDLVVPIILDESYYGRVFMRSANQDQSDVTVGMGVNSFDSALDFIQDSSTATLISATNQWRAYGTPSVTPSQAGLIAQIAFRPALTTGESTVLIALPQILGPDVLLESAFESLLPPAGR